MNTLLQLLNNFPYNHYADLRSIQRGQAYYKDDRIWNMEIYENQAICEVKGDGGDYTVTIEIDKKTGKLVFDCECPHAYDGNFCKHMVAAELLLKDYLELGEDYEEPEEDDEDVAPTRQWKNKLDNIFLQLPRSATSGASIQRYAAFILLEKSQSTGSANPKNSPRPCAFWNIWAISATKTRPSSTTTM